MTTPETARTAARNDFITTTAARHFPDAIRLCAEGHARGEHAMPPRDEIAVDCIHGAIALANKLEEMNAAPWLPEPQASKASEPYTPPPGTPDIRCAMCGSGMMTRLELGRLRRRVAELEAAIPSPASDPKCPPGTCRQCDTCRSDSAPPPASEASQCAFSPGVCNDPKCPDCGPLVASAPAGEAVSVARDVAERCVRDAMLALHELAGKGDSDKIGLWLTAIHNDLSAALSAPPPSAIRLPYTTSPDIMPLTSGPRISFADFPPDHPVRGDLGTIPL